MLTEKKENGIGEDKKALKKNKIKIEKIRVLFSQKHPPGRQPRWCVWVKKPITQGQGLTG